MSWTTHESGRLYPEGAIDRQTPEMNLIRLSDRAALHAAMEKLPPPLLEVILLCDVEEMKYREIAAVLEIPIGTVMSRIARARTALRGALQAQGNAEGVPRMTDHLSSSILNALADGELSAEQLASRKRASCRLPLVHLKRLLSKPAQIGHRKGRSAVLAADRNCRSVWHSAAKSGLQAPGLRAEHVSPSSSSWRFGVLGGAAAVLLVVSASICSCSATLEKRSLLWLSTHALVTEVFDQHIATLAGSLPPEVVSTDRHTVKPWFQGKIPFSFNLPENLPPGTTLDGANLTYLHNQPVAQLLYSIGKHRVSVFVGEKLATGANELPAELSGFQVMEFSTGNLEVVAVSDVDPARLAELVGAIRQAQVQ